MDRAGRKLCANRFSLRLLGGAALLALTAGTAQAEAHTFNIKAQPLATALPEFGVQSGAAVLATHGVTGETMSRGVSDVSDPDVALKRMLEGTGLTYTRKDGAYLIVRAETRVRAIAPAPSVNAAETVSGSAIEGLVVTAQKRREAIQDVPIAISAFSADTLQAQKIEGGFDLLKAIPNVTFSKNNFSGYNFSIRGIGTKAISVTTDPGVAVEFNDTPFIRNRLFEQEYFDIERVEVLRGPQGTLHGRNATAGVINVISKSADLSEFDGSIKGEVGNYHTKRLSGFINMPIIEDVLAVRFAGALTNREGYDYNTVTQNAVNGRDLWSGRLSIGFEPTERLRARFVWERFNEDDNRSRTGKQLCKHDPGRTMIGTFDISGDPLAVAQTSQGCLPVNLYDDDAFGTPNGLSIPFMFLGGGAVLGYTRPPVNPDHTFAVDENGNGIISNYDYAVRLIQQVDPYGGMKQSRDLRVISSLKDPRYRANADIFELNIDFDITDALTLTSQTAYNQDEYYSFQDFNRFNTVPVFNDSSPALYRYGISIDGLPTTYDNDLSALTPGGVYCDPQLGCSNTIVGFDISQAKSTQFSQEVRLQSSFDGRFNFSAGANFTRYKTLEDYYVLFNLFTLFAQSNGLSGLEGIFNSSVDLLKCRQYTRLGIGEVVFDTTDPAASTSPNSCIYIDPNPIESINGQGHNYYRNQNPYKLKSWAGFGEMYFQATDALKITAGLRYTDDEKIFLPVPSQLLLSAGYLGGTTGYGYPTEPEIRLKWQEVSGRIGVDWKPDLAFTDESLLYAFYSRGYKGGGMNPPSIGYDPRTNFYKNTRGYPSQFEPEFVDAFEMGAKNTLAGGAMVLNIGGFYYDYRDYQVSQIKDRTAVNENFDATVWGLEFESMFAPSENLRVNATLGYQDTEIADGERSIDLMNRTQGNPDYFVAKPWFQSPSNCVLPVQLISDLAQLYYQMCPGSSPFFDIIDRSLLPNGGQGIYAELGGNELPNAPHWTVSFGAQYSWDLLDGNWSATVRGDAYWQSQSWARVYNADPYDKLHGWYNTNLSFWIEKPSEDLRIEFYVKNVLDGMPITDAFLNSDDSGLTTNVFTLDPRLIGLQITKGF